MEEFEILIVSSPDREELVAEIWHREILIAEINQEEKELQIEFYLNDRITFDLNVFLEVLKAAKDKLVIDPST